MIITDPNNTFHPFERLPIELRLKIWQLVIYPRFVSITTKSLSKPEGVPGESDAWVSFDPRNCPLDCLSHTRPRKEKVPSILHVCKESRDKGLELYAPFSAGRFEGGYAYFDLDTLYYSRCHHETPTGSPILGNPMGPFGQWQEERSILGAMALVTEEVAHIKSLALCCCQIYGVAVVSNFKSVLDVLQKYKTLQELIFVEHGTSHFVERLKECKEELGPADDATWEAARGGRMRSVRNDSPRGKMWTHMVQVWQFKIRLEELLAESGCEWEIPRIRCAVMLDGKIAWEQEFGLNVQNRVEELR